MRLGALLMTLLLVFAGYVMVAHGQPEGAAASGSGMIYPGMPGPGMMGGGMMGNGAMGRGMMRGFAAKDADTITADIVTAAKDDLAQRYEINRHYGLIRPARS